MQCNTTDFMESTHRALMLQNNNRSIDYSQSKPSPNFLKPLRTGIICADKILIACA